MTENFYGWRVVVAAAIGLACGIATLGASTFSIFVGPLRSEMGWSQPEAFNALIAVTFTAAIMSPFLGAVVDRFGAKRVIVISFVFEILIFASFYFQEKNINSFYFRYFLLSLLALGTTHVAFARVITVWFDQKRGLALGIALSGVGVGGFIWPMFVQRAIDLYGWRVAYLTLAATIAAIAIPLMLWLIKESPTEVGQVPDGINKDALTPVIAPVSGLALIQAIRAPIFWLMLGTFFLIGFAVQSALIHLVPLLTSRGISPMAAAFAQSMMFLSVTFGRLSTGWLMDRFFAPRVAMFYLLAPLVGLALLSADVPESIAIAAALMIGLAVGAEVDVLAYLNSRYFGMVNFARIYGVFYGFYSLSGGVGPVGTAVVVEKFGYPTAMLFLCGTLLASGILLTMFPRFPVLQHRSP